MVLCLVWSGLAGRLAVCKTVSRVVCTTTRHVSKGRTTSLSTLQLSKVQIYLVCHDRTFQDCCCGAGKISGGGMYMYGSTLSIGTYYPHSV
ncbi:hypothetical protein DFP73DRAFT_532755 [Morchella snyderi]|nr:hypothetical protein DFP73DRAFT_532755 [Morchella snyderi]